MRVDKVWFRPSVRNLGNVVTSADGRFQVEIPPPVAEAGSAIRAYFPGSESLGSQTVTASQNVTFQNLSPATTLSLTQMGSGKVAAKLVDDTGSPIAGASLAAEIVDVAKRWGPTERVLSGHVPNRAAYVVIGVRANTEGVTAAARGEADLGAITLTYRDAESQPRIWTSAYAVPYRIALSPDSSLNQNLFATPETTCGNAVIPVAPGSPYRFAVPISATGSADRAGYLTMVFVDSQCDEISRASVYFAPASETLRLPATDHDGQAFWNVPLNRIATQSELRVRYDGDDAAHRPTMANLRLR
jgi:hypothetical protein